MFRREKFDSCVSWLRYVPNSFSARRISTYTRQTSLSSGPSLYSAIDPTMSLLQLSCHSHRFICVEEKATNWVKDEEMSDVRNNLERYAC
jgi:hypothetical protein